MLDIVEILPTGTFNALDAVDRVVLDHDHRARRRIVLHTVLGVQIRLIESRTVQLRHGDGLRLSTGEIVAVEAQPEPLLEITAPSSAELVRIAWHLGNRHLPTQFTGGAIRIRYDHVIAHMLEGLGAAVRRLDASFDPEGGAYAGGAAEHGHHH